MKNDNISLQRLSASPHMLSANIELLDGKNKGAIQALYIPTKPFARWLVQTRRLRMDSVVTFDKYLGFSDNVPLDILVYIKEKIPIVNII